MKAIKVVIQASHDQDSRALQCSIDKNPCLYNNNYYSASFLCQIVRVVHVFIYLFVYLFIYLLYEFFRARSNIQYVQ